MVKIIKRELGTWRGRFILLVSIIGVGAFTLLRMETKTAAKLIEDDIRNIELEIRNMMFGDNNPTISLRPGETVRFTISNLDPGMKHEFNIEGTEVHTRILNYGEADSVLFTTPLEQKEFVYVCNFHTLMMRGLLQVSN